MSNMSYCRFENTYNDLKDCWEFWDDAESESEKKFKEKLAILCKRIANNTED